MEEKGSQNDLGLYTTGLAPGRPSEGNGLEERHYNEQRCGPLGGAAAEELAASCELGPGAPSRSRCTRGEEWDSGAYRTAPPAEAAVLQTGANVDKCFSPGLGSGLSREFVLFS